MKSHLSTITLIIPVWKGSDPFRRCLKSILSAFPPPDELIVVIDGPDEFSKNIASSFGIRALTLSENRGPAAARNIGARIAKSDILFFLDADVIAPPDVFEKVRCVFSKTPQVDAVFGSYDDKPPVSNFFSQFKNLFHHYVHQHAKTDASTFWAGCGAILRSRFEALGGFNEKYRFPSIEDIEFGYRLKEAGGRIMLCKDLTVTHLKHWTFLSLLKTDFFHRGIPWSDLILKKGFTNDLNISQSGRLSVLSSWIAFFSCLLSMWQNSFFAIFLICGIVLILLNLHFYHYLLSRKGFFFVLRAIPFHWFYFFYSGLSFMISFIKYISNNAHSKPGNREFQKN